jgi:putative phosphoesterase
MTQSEAAGPGMASSAAPPEVYTVGVVADTHVPDRVKALHPGLLDALRAAGVHQIFHLGDVCTGRILDQLEQVAPLTAVRGNRDFLIARRLPLLVEMEIHGVSLAVMHAHGGLAPYLWDKALHFTVGYDLTRYMRKLNRASGSAQVVLFGHTHNPVIARYEGKLYFNPGSASFGPFRHGPPSFGLLRFPGNGQIEAEIVRLYGYRVENHDWIRFPQWDK